MTAEAAWSQLRCPDCRGLLESRSANGAVAGLACTLCAARYGVESGIPRLMGSKSQVNRSEVETQDRVSDHYDGVRYQRASSIAYHEDTMAQLVELAPPRPLIVGGQT